MEKTNWSIFICLVFREKQTPIQAKWGIKNQRQYVGGTGLLVAQSNPSDKELMTNLLVQLIKNQ